MLSPESVTKHVWMGAVENGGGALKVPTPAPDPVVLVQLS